MAFFGKLTTDYAAFLKNAVNFPIGSTYKINF